MNHQPPKRARVAPSARLELMPNPPACVIAAGGPSVLDAICTEVGPGDAIVVDALGHVLEVIPWVR